ncbi:hypothetical protein CTA1_5564 [Colletotrichum tanaceti]|uniref:SnoaL-like domain-containing protein n=1 Tax=Colletotrichum tanaceti TaxID=1306861 RepID=A0A4U6XHU3_9PEZI|nr:hypothetical protein CTA1_5564 [Colletotrichum tanaceti]
MASTTSLPAVLSPPLNDREAVADALYRCVIGLDTNDAALFDSAFMPNASFSINGQASQGIQAIHTNCFDVIAKLDTTHFLTNLRIHIDSSKAKLTCTALSQHFRGQKGLAPDQTYLMAGSLYWADLVKDGDLWKIETVQMKSTWAEGDWGVMTGN